MPHYPNGGFESNRDLFKELLKRLFGGGNH